MHKKYVQRKKHAGKGIRYKDEQYVEDNVGVARGMKRYDSLARVA